MKRLFTSGILILCSVLTSLAQFSGSGSGTEESPYLIFNVTQLSQMANFGGQSGVVFRLMKDINVSEWISDNNPRQGWTPIGVSATPFQGKLLGENHTISGLKIARASEDYVGFFGYLSGANISNLTIEGSDITGGSYVGTFAGYSKSTIITNCHVKFTGKVSSSNGSYVGGFIGAANGGAINNFNIETTVNSIRANYVGGFSGNVSNDIVIKNGIVKVDVTNTQQYTGGFSGASGAVTLSDIDVYSTVKGTSFTGGFIGKALTLNASNCHIIGNVTGQSYVSGIIGNSTESSTLANCSYMGNINGNDYLGGIIGQAANAALTSCSRNGDIKGESFIGGMIGNIAAGSTVTFMSCYSKGRIEANGNNIGGIVGASQGACISRMESSSHFGDISGDSYIGGLIGKIESKNEEKPTLNTYTIRTSSTYLSNPKISNTSLSTNLSDFIVEGSTTTISINNCVGIGNIRGENYVAGLIGYDALSVGFSSSTLSYIYENNNVYKYLFINGNYSSWDNQAGKLTVNYIKYSRDTKILNLSNSFYSGNIIGKDNVGGLVGYKNAGLIKNSYSYASIQGYSKVGGIAGQLSIGEANDGTTYQTSILSNVSNNSFIISTESSVGRIYGASDRATIGALGSTQGNRALVTTKVVKSGILQEVSDDLQNGTSIGANALKLKATYGALGWNYDNDWNQLETESYPYKKYQAAPPTITSTLESQATTISGKSVNGGTVYLYYKDKEPVSTVCNGNDWSFATEPLQSGAQVQVYADAEGMTPSYFTTTNVGYPGMGTEEAPFLIYTAEDLQGVNKSGYYKVMNDIDLTKWINENSPVEGWPAIGMNGSEAVYINGDYHKITGLWVNTTKDFNGLFSSFLIGQIKNLTVEVAPGKKVKGGDYTGILIGQMANAMILNCTVKGDVEGTLHVGGVAGALDNTELNTVAYYGNVITLEANAYAGGMTGRATAGSMKSCDVLGAVSGTLNVGGMAGMASHTDLNAVAYTGSLSTSAETAAVGGLLGKAENCTLTDGNAMPTIITSGNGAYVGGGIGYADGGEITKSVANDNISASGTGNYAGGLVGYSGAVITLSNANGSITATGEDSYTGGLVGYATNSVSNSYSTTNVKGTQYTAGLVAYTLSIIDKCYAKGNVTGQFYGGGIVANMDGASAATTNCVAMNGTLSLTAQTAWACRVIGGYGNGCKDPDESNFALSTMQVSLNGIPTKKYDDIMEGISKKQSELMASLTYMDIGWDFANIWGINEGEGYPYLQWELNASPVAEIILDKTSLVVAVDKTATITATVLPLGAANKRLSWKSSNGDVASVKNGVVTAFSVGETTITASSTDGSNVSASCKVTVIPNNDEAIAELQALIDEAQNLYDNSIEGSSIGQYAVGSREALLAVIESVKNRINDNMSAEEVAECMTLINDAIAAFESQKVSAGKDTDISKLDNVIYINRMEVSAGTLSTLSVRMKNAVTAEGFSFDLYLPEGISVAKDADGFPEVELSTERTTAKKTNNFDSAFQPDGSLRVFGYSTNGSAINGNDGEIVIIKIDVATNMKGGEYPVILRNVTVSDDNAISHDVEYVKSTLVVSSLMLGDANNDGKVNVTDLTAIAHHILGNTPEDFDERAADANSDRKINVADLTATAHLILYGSISHTDQSRFAISLQAEAENTDITTMDNVIYIDPVTVVAGEKIALSVKMKNSVTAEGFGFDLYLPEGMHFVLDEDGFPEAYLSTTRTTAKKTNNFDCVIRNSGALRVLAYSSNGSAISGNDGEIVLVNVKIDKEMKPGSYSLLLKEITISDINAKSYDTDLVEASITVKKSGSYEICDVNGDGAVDVADIATIIRYMAGQAAGMTKEQIDVNKDGTVDVADIATIISIMAANARAAQSE